MQIRSTENGRPNLLNSLSVSELAPTALYSYYQRPRQVIPHTTQDRYAHTTQNRYAHTTPKDIPPQLQEQYSAKISRRTEGQL